MIDDGLKLTEEQEQALIDIIDTWYICWKTKITPERTPHRLGVAKEQLKALIYKQIASSICAESGHTYEQIKEAVETMKEWGF